MEILGDCKKDGYEKLMISILTQQIMDYINAREVTDFSFEQEILKLQEQINPDSKKLDTLRKMRSDNLDDMIKNIESEIEFIKLNKKLSKLKHKKQLFGHGENARIYIFENKKESNEYVFGFEFICNYFGLDPEKFRKKIEALRQEHIKKLREVIKEN